MADKSLIWVWGIGAIACAGYGIWEKNALWFASAALCAWNTYRWYKQFYKKDKGN